MSKIPAKIAAILSDSTVALNVGSDKGVAIDDKASVLRVVEITDPDTQEKLGEVGVIILQLRVSHIQPRLCTAHVTSVQDDPPGSTPTRVRKFKKIIDEPFNEKPGFSVYVTTGDLVNVEIKDQSEYSDEPPF